jgi:hypothetical protein
MGLFDKKPKLQDQALSELAQMFFDDPEEPTPGSELLDASRLDFTVESLELVDQHLETMRQRKLNDQEMMCFVLRCGAYVGEVIRRNAKGKQWHWLDYKGAAKLSEEIAAFEEDLGIVAILWDSDGGFCFPLEKVLKYWENGSEDSVKFFAHVMITKSNENA